MREELLDAMDTLHAALFANPSLLDGPHRQNVVNAYAALDSIITQVK